ncbi:MAG: 2,3-bisphosphoglycerate-independent phosphoglycerate mutase [Planctomycetota bacterium]
MPPLLLLVMDGWGYSPARDGNAIALARTPVWDRIWRKRPSTLVHCSGENVGLPKGIMGNSEVGHLNLGAGRVVWQELSRIDNAIADGSLFVNPVILAAIAQARAPEGRLHLWGLLSDGGVHSSQEHLHALLEFCRKQGLLRDKVALHPILDGRDTPPKSGEGYIARLLEKMNETGVGVVATVTGRYWTMDRDKRWERVARAYECLVNGKGREAPDALTAIRGAYAAGETDEFVNPIVIPNRGKPLLMEDGDSVICFNFRTDRAREFTWALTQPDFAFFPRERRPDVLYTCLTRYDEKMDLPIIFEKEELRDLLGHVLSRNNLHQLRIAETEKYAHVTFFFNGQVETPEPGEDRILIPSPKVATYDLKPEMSAPEVTEKVCAAIRSRKYRFILLNYANGDMVGHTGILPATIKAVETVDECVGKVLSALENADGDALITADHGNAEMITDPATGGPFTAHTTNPVPLVYVGGRNLTLRDGGRLADVAPTCLEMLGLEQPKAMTGRSLISRIS